jgi:lipopolysaccharide transport system permease protein
MNLIWVNLILGCVCVRYRDIPQIIASILQVVFYVTPIMWMPENIASQNIHTLVNFNPVYHMIEIVRQPLLGNIPSIYNWLISITINIIGWLVALRFFASYKSRITYWL